MGDKQARMVSNQMCVCVWVCLRVRPGICRSGGRLRRTVATPRETLPHAWCAPTTASTGEGEREREGDRGVKCLLYADDLVILSAEPVLAWQFKWMRTRQESRCFKNKSGWKENSWGGATAARPELPFDAEIGTFYCKASNEVKAFTSMSSLIEVSGGIQSVSILNVTWRVRGESSESKTHNQRGMFDLAAQPFYF